MVSPAAKQSAEAQTYLDQLYQGNARIVRAHTLMQPTFRIEGLRFMNMYW
jgi:hypothetical protein